ncbi:uncharacterized protein LOC131662511 isoform X1 [Vicia villosa]|uniref:uncharacterized protein LOC131662511 isoform X1 n=1 Tax=Vicia villosa TaxID=3911 RepID=UPI00273BDD24|nr:uncharacterized protein LOC131662511 isoform X1 [Vicia villosa]
MHFCILLDHLLGTTPLLSVLSSGTSSPITGNVLLLSLFIWFLQYMQTHCFIINTKYYININYARMLLSKYSMWLTSAVCFELFLELYFLYTDRESQKLRLQMKVLTLLGIQLVHLRRLKLLPKQTEG